MKQLVIIGAGAAGCFCAIEYKRRHPDVRVTVLEAGARPLAKVAVTGGGRCNFTNSFEGIRSLEEAYPRGARLMKRALRAFSHTDAMDWFSREGVPYVIQEDNCVFPKSQDAMQIVRTLENLMRSFGVTLVCKCRVESVEYTPESHTRYVVNASSGSFDADCVAVTTGGGALELLRSLEIAIEKPVPSLFTLKLEDEGIRSLMGAVVNDVILAIPGTSFKSSGTLLLTDWGVSGPATLKLSSYAARYLSGNGYKGQLLINWMAWTQEQAWDFIRISSLQSRKQVSNTPPHALTQRLWLHIIGRAGLRRDIVWAELGTKGAGRLVNAICADVYDIAGRCHFKSEFVTCGGVSLQEIVMNTLESRKYPGLFFAGEVLDIDAITGGFNLQAAWSTAMVVAGNINL